MPRRLVAAWLGRVAVDFSYHAYGLVGTEELFQHLSFGILLYGTGKLPAKFPNTLFSTHRSLHDPFVNRITAWIRCILFCRPDDPARLAISANGVDASLA